MTDLTSLTGRPTDRRDSLARLIGQAASKPSADGQRTAASAASGLAGPAASAVLTDPIVPAITADPPPPAVEPDDPLPIYFFGDHNTAYYCLKKEQIAGRLEPGAVLVHFDTHADIPAEVGYKRTIVAPVSVGCGCDGLEPDQAAQACSLYSAKLINVANWIIPALWDGSVSEVYWVLPEYIKDSDRFWANYWIQPEVWAYLLLRRQDISYNPLMSDRSSVRFRVGAVRNDQLSFLYFSPDDPPPELDVEDLRWVTVHKVYAGWLPDFRAEARPIVLDIDADYFANTGWETDGGACYHPSSGRVRKEVREFLRLLQDKDLVPAAITFSRSPEYCPTRLVDDIEEEMAAGLSRLFPAGRFERLAPSYSLTLVHFARCLSNFLEGNQTLFALVFRLDLSGEQRAAVCADLNDAKIKLEMRYINEDNPTTPRDLGPAKSRSLANNVTNRFLPPPGCEKVKKLKVRRGDYGWFIDRAEDYGLKEIAADLRQIQTLQNDPASDWAVLSVLYKEVWGLLQPYASYLKDQNP